MDANGNKLWETTFGGTGDENGAASVQKTADGGFFIGARSTSGVSGNKTSPGRGGEDYWLLRIDANGNKLWERTYGGTGDDRLSSVEPTADGGYIIGGSSSSPVSGNKTSERFGTQYSDYWIIKVDANGAKQWERTFGGENVEQLNRIAPTKDGNYILYGSSFSSASGNKTAPLRGSSDYWIVKIDGSGNHLWDKSFGGTENDSLMSLHEVSDGSYILIGMSTSQVSGNKTSPGYYGVMYEFPGIPPIMGVMDGWIVKLDINGGKQWEQTLGGLNMDFPMDLEPTQDGGYLVALRSSSSITGTKSTAGFGKDDYWLVKLNGSGGIEWDKTYGAGLDDSPNRMRLTSDGGCIITGVSNSGATGNKTAVNHGGNDFWVVKVDGSGNKQWDQSFGGTDEDTFNGIQEVGSGSFIISGQSKSGISGNKITTHFGGIDLWIIKLAAPVPTPPVITSHPLSQTLPVGANVTFSVAATGTDPLTYIWTKNGVPITGATAATYTIANIQTSHAGNYSAFVQNSLGFATSFNATLSVYTCDYALSLSSKAFSTSSGTGTVSVSAPGSCSWTVVNTNSWISLTSGNTGTGNGSFSYSVSANAGRPRGGFIRVGNATHAVTQNGVVPAGRFDFNGDSSTDLLLQRNDGVVAAWMMNGTNFLGSSLLRNGTPAAGWRAAGVGDFNNDSKADVLFQNNVTGSLAAWFMNGTNYLSAGALRNGVAIALAWQVAGAADFNNDGKTDVLLQNTDGRSTVWFMNGTNFLSSLALRNGVAAPAGWRIAGTGDFNGDGQTDIVWQHNDGRIAAWHFVAGTYTYATLLQSGPPATDGTKIWAVADFNLNGKPDLFWHNPGTGAASIWLFNHTTLVRAIPWRNIGSQWRIAGPK